MRTQRFLSVSLVIGLMATAGCEQNLGKTVSGLQSLIVELKSPGPDDRGTDDNPTTVRDIVFDVHAFDANGQPYDDDFEADVYVAFSASRIGALTPCGTDEDRNPLMRIRMTRGVAEDQHVQLNRVFGKVQLWVEEVARDGRNIKAYGASPDIVYGSPTIPDIQTPLDLNASTATYCTPFNGKQINLVRGTGSGQLVVTSVFPNAYVVADTGAPFDRATETGGFNNLYVFTFGRPPFFIEPGRVLGKVGGNISKFVGFTELNFPYQQPSSASDLVQVPPPFELTSRDRSRHIFLLHVSSATVTTTASICPINVNGDDWKKFNQFTIHYGDRLCDSFSTFQVALPAKVFGTFDPLNNIDKPVSVTGTLRNFSGQNDVSPRTLCTTTQQCADAGFPTASCVEGSCKKGAYNFWTILPRDPSDIVLK